MTPDAWTYRPYNLENNADGVDADALSYYTVQRTAMGKPRASESQEDGRPKQHPAGMTVSYPHGLNAAIVESPAEWASPKSGAPDENYADKPSSDYRGKVIVNDTDHLWGHAGGDAVWVWKSFCRGLNVLFIEELTPSPTWQNSARNAMG